ncbi:type II secretion system F family protein [Nocardiopsis metallicus]|uniref:Flp pilus assembly protein TadB n=1 Tax=Nocardiopsis metallicus TaxID=179819 RepID=A0A840WCD6_9ACTN|nr:type II secretion system F family protein [Nocardiopsis metallicus]MBB5494690.1 Flp pilus assembly protein TadB [Nocardiopsis metallicus]
MAAGVLLMVAGIRRAPARANRPRGVSVSWDRRQIVLGLSGVVLGAVGWVVTGWVLAIVIAPLAVVGLPYLLGGGKQAQQAITRLEGVEEWVRLLATRLSAGIWVEQALVSSAMSAPEAIKPEVERLAARIRSGRTTEDALHAFAAELASPVSDLVCSELVQASRSRSHGVAHALTQLAELVSEEVSMHRQIEAERSKPRTTARLVIVLTLGAGAALAVFGDFMDPYASATGQLALAAVVACFVLAMVWMRRLTTPQAAPRFLVEEGQA